MSDIHKKLVKIQKELKAPKNQKNTFGNYNYRSCEDIMEAVKPLLHEEGLILLMYDDVVNIGNHNYIKANACIQDGEHSIHCAAFAREPESQKGMADPQITGSASSYARKYALNGLFAIDDTKDADSTNKHGKEEPVKKQENINGLPSVEVLMLEIDSFSDEVDLKEWKKDKEKQINDCGDKGKVMTKYFDKIKEIKK